MIRCARFAVPGPNPGGVQPGEGLAGCAALSKAGRDAGRMMVVLLHADAHTVYLADGDLRKAGKPKKKKLRHLVLLPGPIMELSKETLENRDGTLDAKIRAFLAMWEDCAVSR